MKPGHGLQNGTYKGRAVGETVLGTSKDKGTPFIEVYFEVTDGESKGQRARWSGWFGPNSERRTAEALQYCGFEGDDLSVFSDGGLHGLDTNEVEIVVEREPYTDKEGNEHEMPRVQWVNKLGGFLSVQSRMPEAEARAFGDKMRGIFVDLKLKKGQPPAGGGTDFNYGANANETKATGTGGRKF